MNCPHCQASLNSFVNFMQPGGAMKECPQCKKPYVIKNDWKKGILVAAATLVVAAVGLTFLIGDKPS